MKSDPRLAGWEAAAPLFPVEPTVYISGPMTGMPGWNFPAFHAAESEWLKRGWAVRNPARNFNGETGHPRAIYMRLDIAALLECTAIAMLPGWESSEGARCELLVAQELDLDVFDALTALPMVRGWDLDFVETVTT